MSAPAYLPLFGSDYLADTRHLSTEEHGAYLLLMMAAWRQEDCSLPLDDKKLARITGLSLRKWVAIRDTILEFWDVADGRITQGRLLKEWRFAAQKSESNRKSARARWDAQATENNEVASCERISERNAPQPQPQEEEPNGSSPPKSPKPKRGPSPPSEPTFPCPDGVDPMDWDGLKANRKAKRAPLTAGAHRQITTKLDAWARSGWPPGPIVANAAERGWTTVFETDAMKANPHGDRRPPARNDDDDPRNPYVKAVLRRQAARARDGVG